MLTRTPTTCPRHQTRHQPRYAQHPFCASVPRKGLSYIDENGLPGIQCLGSAAKTGTFDLYWPFLPTTGTSATRHFCVYAQSSAGQCRETHKPSLGTYAGYGRGTKTFIAEEAIIIVMAQPFPWHQVVPRQSTALVLKPNTSTTLTRELSKLHMAGYSTYNTFRN